MHKSHCPACGIDVHAHVVPEKFPHYIGSKTAGFDADTIAALVHRDAERFLARKTKDTTP